MHHPQIAQSALQCTALKFSNHQSNKFQFRLPASGSLTRMISNRLSCSHFGSPLCYSRSPQGLDSLQVSIPIWQVSTHTSRPLSCVGSTCRLSNYVPCFSFERTHNNNNTYAHTSTGPYATAVVPQELRTTQHPHFNVQPTANATGRHPDYVQQLANVGGLVRSARPMPLGRTEPEPQTSSSTFVRENVRRPKQPSSHNHRT